MPNSALELWVAVKTSDKKTQPDILHAQFFDASPSPIMTSDGQSKAPADLLFHAQPTENRIIKVRSGNAALLNTSAAGGIIVPVRVCIFQRMPKAANETGTLIPKPPPNADIFP